MRPLFGLAKYDREHASRELPWWLETPFERSSIRAAIDEQLSMRHEPAIVRLAPLDLVNTRGSNNGWLVRKHVSDHEHMLRQRRLCG